MVNILLSVLKGIGILLAVLFLLILFFLLLILLGPIGYRASGRYREEKSFSVGISWLGIVIRCRASYEEGSFLWGIRLFGILIASNDEEFLKKKEEKQRKKAEKEAARADENDEAIEKNLQIEVNAEEEQISVEEAEKCMKAELTDKEMEDAVAEGTEVLEPGETDEEESDVLEEIDIEEEVDVLEETDETLPQKKKTIFQTVKEKITFIKTKINNIIRKIKSIPEKIRNLIASVRAKLDRAGQFKEFFLGEENRPGFLHIINNLIKMLRHILPVKLQGKIEFGLEDPYTMGQVLTVLAIFYPMYEDKFKIHPDFENPGFAGEFSLRGRIIPGYLLFRLLVIIFNKDVRRIIKEGSKLIGGNES